LANPAPVEASRRGDRRLLLGHERRGGDELALFVSTKPVAEWSVEWYRTEYYDGNGGRLVPREEPPRRSAAGARRWAVPCAGLRVGTVANH
jgi:hypothetical protein